MTESTKTTRITNITLTNKDFSEMVKMYLKRRGVIDTDQHVTFEARNTRDERGLELDVVLNNYNKLNNIYTNK
jgi:hypothetical protein